ncbi:23S rRNA pseudouridine(955/2504/2580) synthase RluC [Acidithiobacillus ferriphilus]|uniref:23S rRNA pseudouridine(955/2504/2580) synthase RluC n=1 Tax=Acidithiobacillus ferriphilus TaxID=1689834 RepID=UPI00232FB0E7|nr:23S rRNA pseudouridine(955/2504/2580) synthase RluC [Acidithiobacillus ferriphilus]WCE94719.1 23S rRNA pseudouridine(955/2504/2580) synthase RluC [Acidithiobacillus ferriphilus]
MAENVVRQWLVSDAEAGQRLDNFLLRVMKGVPRSHIYKILRSGEVRVNKGRARPYYHLAEGDVLRLPPVRVAEPGDPALLPGYLRSQLEAAVLYEDTHLLVLDKPSGLAVHGGSGLSWGIIEALRQLRPDARELELVHRLDRDTSGCLILSKKRSALRALHEALREGLMEKRYLALAAGDWQGKARAVRLALRKNTLQSGERMVRVDLVEGKAAHTRFLPLEHFPGAVLLQADLDTGRTHQIRVHLQAIGHAVAGDEKYGDAVFNQRLRALGLRRLFLHAALVAFRHPQDGRPMRIEAPLPADLQSILTRLRQPSAG